MSDKIVGVLTHAGTAESGGIGIRLDADRENIDTLGIDVDISAKVGEASTDIVGGIDGTDGDGLRGRAGRGVGSVLLYKELEALRFQKRRVKKNVRSRYRRQQRGRHQRWQWRQWRC